MSERDGGAGAQVRHLVLTADAAQSAPLAARPAFLDQLTAPS